MTEKDHKNDLHEFQVDPNSQTINSLKLKTLKTEPKLTRTTTKTIKKATSERMKTIEENSPSQKEIQTDEENNKISLLKPPNLMEKNLKNPKLSENRNESFQSIVFTNNLFLAT